jgi:adenine deaminase
MLKKNMMEKKKSEISGQIVDVVSRRIFPGKIVIENGKISAVSEEADAPATYILPGLIDAHIHIESSMLIPSEFARMAVVHGTVATVSDPHEIGNVLGMEGIQFMIRNGKKVPFRFYFGAPSCVPATGFETAGSSLGLEDIENLLRSDDIKYLSEMMNFPGVLFNDPDVMQKLALAKKYNKPVDGHAPGVNGEQAAAYAGAGITTDHECFTMEEAIGKIRYGMSILIREGSAAKNFEALAGLISLYPDKVMFCSDDKHPNDLAEGHMDQLIRRSLAMGFDKFDVLRACTFNPVKHYHLDAGLLQCGDAADFIIVDDLEKFTVLQTFINGQEVARNGKTLISSVREEPVNKFNAHPVDNKMVEVPVQEGKLKVIQCYDGQLVTGQLLIEAKNSAGFVDCDLEQDILKIVVKNRYSDAPPAVGFINGFGLKKGALASSVAHDSHNIIAVGTNDASIAAAMNLIIESKGGVGLVNGDDTLLLPLPFAGIMSSDDGWKVANTYEKIDRMAKQSGSTLHAPYMTLSFMALLVIPDLKLGDKGLFDGKTFSFTELWEK